MSTFICSYPLRLTAETTFGLKSRKNNDQVVIEEAGARGGS